MLNRLSQDTKSNLELNAIFDCLHAVGARVILVGGAVRDYFLQGTFGNDYDFEVHNISPESFQHVICNELEKIDFITHIEKLPFSIIRASSKNYEFEFSLPRIEFYEQEKKFYKHSEFDVTFYKEIDLRQSFKRRDFTINAIGLEKVSGRFTIQDPFSGLNDIQSRSLRNCSFIFFNDPVRFLRLIRFKNSLHLIIDDELLKNIHLFQLEGLSLYHFLNEGLKTDDFLQYVDDFFSLCDTNNIPITKSLNIFRDIYKLKPNVIQCRDSLLYHVVDKRLWTEEEIFSLAQALGIKKKVVKSLILYIKSKKSEDKRHKNKELDRFLKFQK